MKLLIVILLFQTCLNNNLFEVNKELLEKFVKVNQSDVKKPQCNFYILKLRSWIKMLEKEPLFFENPFVNFKALKTLAMDIPRACQQKKYRKSKSTPSKEHVQGSIEMIIEIMDTYEIKTGKMFDYIPEIDASDCFVFCSLALDYSEEEEADEATFSLAELFFEKGTFLMKQFPEEGDNIRNEKLMKRAAEALKDIRNWLNYKHLCTGFKLTHSKNDNGICKTMITSSLRVAKVEVLNEDPLVEIYEDCLSPKELDTFSGELSKYSFEPGLASNEDGTNDNVTFKVQKDIYNVDNKVVNDMQKIIDDLTGLLPDVEDYTQVIKYRPGGQFSPHLDFYTEEQLDPDDELGNRVGHAMIFLQDVELGGGFAMPELGIYVSPKAGRMVHWRNVDRNGENAPLSLHGGCRVYSGNKQVAIKDYHQPFQKHWVCREHV